MICVEGFWKRTSLGEGSLAELAERFHVTEGWAEKISATLRRTGKKERPAGGKRGPKSRLSPEATEYLRSRGERATGSDAGGATGRSWVPQKHRDRDYTTLGSAEADGTASQKKSLHAGEQDSERVKARRRFWQREARHIDPAQLIFVDESGVTDDWRRPMLTLSSIESPTDGDVFRAYPEHVLCPQLKPGLLVVMDNPGTYKVDGIGELIEQTGAALCYLLPYSPDFNPLEKCRAQVKQKLRALKTRSLAALQHALPGALSTALPKVV